MRSLSVTQGLYSVFGKVVHHGMATFSVNIYGINVMLVCINIRHKICSLGILYLWCTFLALIFILIKNSAVENKQQNNLTVFSVTLGGNENCKTLGEYYN